MSTTNQSESARTDESRRAIAWIAGENACGRRPMFLSGLVAAKLKRAGLIRWERGWSLTANGHEEAMGGVLNPPIGGGK